MQLRTLSYLFVTLLLSCCLFFSLPQPASQAVDNPLLKYQVKEKISSFSSRDIAQDILNQLSKKEYSSVNELFSFLVNEKPMCEEGTRLLEEVYFALLRTGSEEIFDAWCKSEESSHAAYILRGRWYIGKAMNARGSDWAYTLSPEQRKIMRENFDKAHNDLVKAYEMNPADPTSSAKMISVCLGKGFPEQVMESWFAKSIAADPLSLSAYEVKFYYLQPIWYGSQEKLKAYAEDCFQNAPLGSSVYSIMLYYIDYTITHEIRGKSPIGEYLERPDVKHNISTAFDRLLVDFPKSVKYKRLRAKFLAYEGATGQMLDIYNETIKKHPELAETYYERAFFYLNSEMYDKAEADYLKLITLDSKNAMPHLRLATIYEKRDNNFDKALMHLDKAVTMQPNDKNIVLKRALLYMKFQKYEKAIDDFTSVLSIDPFNSYALSRRADTYEQLGQIDNAVNDILKMKELVGRADPAIENQLNRLLDKGEQQKIVSEQKEQENTSPPSPATQSAPNIKPLTSLSAPEIDALFQQGESFFYRKKAADARKVFTRILEEQPENSQANFMMGRIADKLEHDYQQAVTYYSRAIAVDGKNEKFFLYRGNALYMLRSYEQAIVDFSTVLYLVPHHGPAVYYRALCFDALGDRETAIKDMKLASLYDLEHSNEARKYLDQHARSFNTKQFMDPIQEMTMLAEEDMRLERYDEAEKTWQKILKEDPKNDYALFRQGIIAIQRDRDHKKAISLFTKAIQQKNTRTDYYYNRGRAQMFIKDYDAAIANYDELLSVNPNYGPGYYYRAECLEKKGDFAKAEQDLLKAKKYAPDRTKSIDEMLARLSPKTGTQVKPTSENIDLLINRSDSYLGENNFKAAIKDLDTVLELEPDNDKALYKLGRIYEKNLDNREKAVSLYSKAIALSPNTTDYLYKRGMAYYHLKEYSKSVEDFTACLDIKENKDQCLYYRGMAYKHLNNRDQAIDDLLKAKEMNASWGETVDYALSEMIK